MNLFFMGVNFSTVLINLEYTKLISAHEILLFTKVG